MKAKEGRKTENLLGWNEMKWNKAESDLGDFVVSQLPKRPSFFLAGLGCALGSCSAQTSDFVRKASVNSLGWYASAEVGIDY
jgi:hypothetical protein